MERLVAKDIITTKLNKTEINVLVNVFRSSMNENNLLTMEEFRGVYIIENDALAQATFDMFDTNKSGDIDIHEFINGYSRWKECLTNTGDRQLLAFSMFDVNETGSLTRETFKEMLKATMDVSQFDLPFISSVATRELAEAFFKACGEAGPYSPEIVVDYRKILHILRNASWSKTMLNFTADDIEKLFFAESGKEEVNFDMNISELISLLICVQANKLLPEIDNLLNL
jgi:Ca2+-binding EF-hand superfamily protein